MTKQEVLKLLILIEKVYPSFLTKDETVLHWFKIGQFLEYEKVWSQLMQHIRKSPYPPTIDQLYSLDGARKQTNINEAGESTFAVFFPSWMHEYSTK